MTKARHFLDAGELSRIAKKPALRSTSPSVNYQTIFDKMRNVFVDVLYDQSRTAEVNAAQAPNPYANIGSKNNKTAPVTDLRLPVTCLVEVLAVRYPLVALFGFRTR